MRTTAVQSLLQNQVAALSQKKKKNPAIPAAVNTRITNADKLAAAQDNLETTKSTMAHAAQAAQIIIKPSRAHAAAASRMIHGVGLGFRREIAREILNLEKEHLPFLEFAPENWMGIGGHFSRMLRQIVERYPILCHGLSLSLGSPEPLDWEFLKDLKGFFSKIPVQLYSEHLSYCKCGNAHFYDLLPLPFTEEVVEHVSQRIKEVQDFLERKIAIENVSYYSPVTPKMSEAEFLTSILRESDCLLLLDVNNVYVNSFNHGYDPYEFLENMPLDKVAYIHMAGHEQKAPDLIIDTHGEPIIDPVYRLFEWTVQRVRPVPVLLERDFNFNDFEALLSEVNTLQRITSNAWSESHVLC